MLETQDLSLLALITNYILAGFLIVLLLIIIFLTVYKHKVYGFTLWLLIIMEIACVLYFTGTIFY